MKNEIRKLEEAVVVHSYWKDDMDEARFTLKFPKESIVFKYELYRYTDEDATPENPKYYVSHDYDCIEPVCPFCLSDRDSDCLDFSEEFIDILREKLIQSNLKLMYHLR